MTRIDGTTFDRVYIPSVGPDLRYSVNNWLSIRADYALQLIDTGNARYALPLALGCDRQLLMR